MMISDIEGAQGDAPEPASRSDLHSETTLDEMAQPKLTHALNSALLRCIEACIACSTACTACANACLAEEPLHDLASCILMNTDCADICHMTGQALMRQPERDWQMLRTQVDVCQRTCGRCATVCEQYALQHEHCRVCGESCRRCQNACAHLLAALPD